MVKEGSVVEGDDGSIGRVSEGLERVESEVAAAAGLSDVVAADVPEEALFATASAAAVEPSDAAVSAGIDELVVLELRLRPGSRVGTLAGDGLRKDEIDVCVVLGGGACAASVVVASFAFTAERAISSKILSASFEASSKVVSCRSGATEASCSVSPDRASRATGGDAPSAVAKGESLTSLCVISGSSVPEVAFNRSI